MTDESEEKWSGNPMMHLRFAGYDYILKSAYDSLRIEIDKLQARNRLLLANLVELESTPTSAYEVKRDRSSDDELWLEYDVE
jgi:hypothetical protein